MHFAKLCLKGQRAPQVGGGQYGNAERRVAAEIGKPTVFCQETKNASKKPDGKNPADANLLLQRKCACGGSPSVTAECTECGSKRRKRKIEPTSEIPARAGSNWPHHGSHDLARIRLNAMHALPRPLTLAVMSTRESEHEEDEEKYSGEGVRETLAGSGTCQNGGASSVCKPATGLYEITVNNNTCCTKDCSKQHEERHVSDITGWGCCAALSTAYNKPGADKGALITKYNEWLAKVYDITECNALNTGVACADAMLTAKDCAGAGKDTDCCKDIVDYKARYGALATTVCGRKAKTVEPCPAF